MNWIFKKIDGTKCDFYQIKKNRDGRWIGRDHWRHTHPDNKPSPQVLPIGVHFSKLIKTAKKRGVLPWATG